MSDRRRLLFDGAQNFRDLGGYRVAGARRLRWGVIYRSDNLAGLTDDDLPRFTQLGLRTVVDLRVAFERERAPDRLPADSRLEVVQIDLQPKGGADLLRGVRAGTLDAEQVERRIGEQYRRFVLDHGPEFRDALDVVQLPQRLPLLFHCTSGKDRTGFVIAALLLALGADRETIVTDFLLSNEFRRDIGHLFGASTPARVIELIASVQRSYLEAALDQIDETYGGADAYLETALGIDREKRARLVTLLTEEVP